MKNLPGDSGLPPGVTNKSIDRRGRELMNMHQCELCEQLIRAGRTLCNRCERDCEERDYVETFEDIKHDINET